MKRILAFAVVALLAIGGVFAVVPATSAVSAFESNDQESGSVTLAKDTVHDGAFFATAADVVIDGTINGDLYCAGQAITINGTVNGDVLCAGQKITINGTVGQDVRSAGQFVTVSGQVGGTVTAFGQDVTIAKSATVAKDVNGAGQTFTIDGVVEKDFAAGSQKLTVNGTVKGSAHADAEVVSLTSRPAIVGDFTYMSRKEHSFGDGAVGGSVNFTESSYGKDYAGDSGDVAGAVLGMLLFIGVMMVVTSVVLAFLMPRYFERSYNLLRSNVGQAILVGLAFAFAVPVLIVVLLFTVIGIPLALLLLAAYFIVKILAIPFAAYYLARIFFGTSINNIVLLVLVGSIILTMLCFVPIINFFVILAAGVVGSGALLMTVTKGYRRPDYSVEQQPVVIKKKKV